MSLMNWMLESELQLRQVYAHEFQLQTQLQLQSTLIQTQHQLYETRFQMQQTEIAKLRETDRRRQAQMAETLRVMGDIRREIGDMQAELLALRGQPRRAGQPLGDARVPNHQEAPRDADKYSAAVAESGAETRVHTPAPGEFEAKNGLPDLIRSSEPKPLVQHMPRPP
nr:hypothetical protein [Tanacetum cinerariifolium]